MKQKTTLKIVVDIGMTVMLLLLMTYELIGEAAYEWLGIGMFALFIIHHILNRKWSLRVFKGNSYLADGSCHWSPDYDGRFHVWRGDSFQARIIVSAIQRRAGFCQRDSHGFGLLWICIDFTPSWTTLEHDDGDGKAVCKRTSNCRKMDASWDCRLYRRVWRVCFHTTGNRALYVLTKSICVFRF